ncbi:TPA: heparinase II/III family protein [Vibrio cholerae]|uniref:heparinase II/III family protein n=1 Tax=Vibrio cholerae TaxID=666 RepID=UPI001A9DE1D1|nr:heparinase II/III family protein [Vibrio cholerae]EGR2449692.1 alginate lyase family protein [Vibrio cholerae]EGR4283670.1 alginate lyase family protein [Vibrio cholerae]EKF9168901.1 alginate lyase family protein [Vibrio cholerae]MBO1382308.1 heparinase [Vibrio cholerae]MBO1396707.1 heparinase [Vibrio cholerae]
MSFFTKVMLVIQTIRYLRSEQIFYRLKYRYFPLRFIANNSYDTKVNDWVWVGPEIFEQSLFDGGWVRYLNIKANFKDEPIWNNTRFEKLWLYNLHYFDDLNALDSDSRQTIQASFIDSWIADNPPVVGNGWEPYPLSLRIVNWIKWYNRAGINNPKIILSLHQQAQALSKQLEYHILGNHLFANGKALVFAGCFLQGDLADSYLEIGLKILEREIPEQFLADGGHFELSPMYHCILLWDLLELIQLAAVTQHARLVAVETYWRQVAQKALNWLSVMIHADGDVSFFNDSAIGIAASPQQIFNYAASLGLKPHYNEPQRLHTLADSGYSKINMPAHSLIFDHAQVGPDYLPGHAHADTLSFEWSVGNQRVFVNSGTSMYGVSHERLRQRKTSAHNTIEVEGHDSSEVWSGFRVARRAKALLESAATSGEWVTVTAAHDGYRRLKGKVTHRRTIAMAAKQLIVSDQLTGAFKQAVAHFHLHPDVQANVGSDGSIQLQLTNGQLIEFRSTGLCQLVDTSWHPYFGHSVATLKIAVTLTSPELQTTVTLL